MNKTGVNLSSQSYKKSNKCSFEKLLFSSKDNNTASKKMNNSMTIKKDNSNIKHIIVKIVQKPKCEELKLMQSFLRIQKRKERLVNYSNDSLNFSSINSDMVNLNAKEKKKLVIPCLRLKKKHPNEWSSLNITLEGNDKLRAALNMKQGNNQSHSSPKSHPVKKFQPQSALPKVSYNKSKSSYDSKLYQLSEMKERSSTKSRKVSQCFKRLFDENIDYEIVFNEEKEKILFNEKPKLVKTSLIKFVKRRPSNSFTKDKDTSYCAKNPPETSDFSELIKQEKEKANAHYMRKKQLMLDSYQKQKKNNCYFMKPKALNVISINHIKQKNTENMKLLQNEFKKRMSSNVDEANKDIKGFKKAIVSLLDDNLAGVRSELNHLGNDCKDFRCYSMSELFLWLTTGR